MLSNKDESVREAITKLNNLVRAEYNQEGHFLSYYAHKDILSQFTSVKNEVIYGRRGTGKTHLLKALQEQFLDEEGFFPIYIDIRNLKPISQTDPIFNAMIILYEMFIEILITMDTNLDRLGEDTYSQKSLHSELSNMLSKLQYSFNGKIWTKPTDTSVKFNDVSSIKGSFLGGKSGIEAKGEIGKTRETQKESKNCRFISFSEINMEFERLINLCKISRIVLLIDEWSEIEIETQPYVAEFIKRLCARTKISVKIGAILYRSKFIENGLGLEVGGDIFSYNLDNRNIYEINKIGTIAFFNELLNCQLSIPQFEGKTFCELVGTPQEKLLNYFFANQALKEILIASAGIPRDFLSIFINAYFIFYSTDEKHLTLNDIRKATAEWYENDKSKIVQENREASIFLQKLIDEIIVKKNRFQFLIPVSFCQNKQLNDLIDLRIIHLRKNGISHKDKPGILYNVYSLDYSCYTSQSIKHNSLDCLDLSKIDLQTADDLRDIRRVSLEKSFFDSVNFEIGEGIKCPFCKEIIDTKHLVYVKHKMCPSCGEKTE